MGQFEIVFCWLPSHVGIAGNTKADQAAKEALDKSISPMSVPHKDYKPYINKYIRDLFQKLWDTKEFNKLHEFKPQVGYTHLDVQSRFDQVILRRCRIGHCRFTHEYLLKAEAEPFCIPCNEKITVKHILLECVDFAQTRDRFYQVQSLL